MQSFYWKDLEDPATGAWQGLALQCQKPGWRAPVTRLLSGNNGRLQWVCGERTLFWATQARDWSGVWLVRTMANLPPEAMPIAPINSVQVERGKTWSGNAWFKNWSRFFADQLRERPGSFLHNGQWLMRGVRNSRDEPPRESVGSVTPEALNALIEHWRYEVWGRSSQLPNWNFNSDQRTKTRPDGSRVRYGGLFETLSTGPVQWLNWWISGNDGLIALRQPRDDEARVRWWRKKASERALPPILALYLSCLDACIIVDGHCRLRAALLEGMAPDIIVMALTEIFPKTPPDPAIQDRIVASLMKEQKSRGSQFMPVEQLNQVLIATFDNTPIVHAASNHAWARLSEDRWRAQVREYLTQASQTEHLNDIFEREGL